MVVVAVISSNVRQREQIQYLLDLTEYCLLGCSGNDLVVCDSRAGDFDGVAIAIHRGGKISLPLRSRRCIELGQALLRDLLTVELLAPEEKQLAFVFIEACTRNDHRTAQRVPGEVIAVKGFGRYRGALTGKPVIGVHALVAMDEADVTVELVGATLGNDCDLSPGRFTELRLVVRV